MGAGGVVGVADEDEGRLVVDSGTDGFQVVAVLGVERHFDLA